MLKALFCPQQNIESGAVGIEQTQGKDLNDWLPITASRKAKWWYSAFHNVTAMVGAGVLGLPFAFSQLGWYYIYPVQMFAHYEKLWI